MIDYFRSLMAQLEIPFPKDPRHRRIGTESRWEWQYADHDYALVIDSGKRVSFWIAVDNIIVHGPVDLFP